MARRLEGKPFHLVATHRQRDSKENVVEYVKSKGLSADSPNMTITSFGGHPKVRGNGYVPYYMVFDHHGDLVHHHMCGAFHGGDGLKMIEIVDELLESVPAMYVGKEPFSEFGRLARQISKVERLPAAIAQIHKRLAAEPTVEQRAELERLTAAIDDYRSRMLGQVERLQANDPPALVPHLKRLQAQFRGTDHYDTITARLTEFSQSETHAQAVKIYKSYRKTMAKLEKDEPTPKQKRSAIKKLQKLIDGHDELPITKKIRAAIGALSR